MCLRGFRLRQPVGEYFVVNWPEIIEKLPNFIDWGWRFYKDMPIESIRS